MTVPAVLVLKGQQLRELTVLDETLDLSRTDVVAKDLVEPNVKLGDNHFEITLPLKANVELLNNLANAGDRATALKKRL